MSDNDRQNDLWLQRLLETAARTEDPEEAKRWAKAVNAVLKDRKEREQE